MKVWKEGEDGEKREYILLLRESHGSVRTVHQLTYTTVSTYVDADDKDRLTEMARECTFMGEANPAGAFRF